MDYFQINRKLLPMKIHYFLTFGGNTIEVLLFRFFFLYLSNINHTFSNVIFFITQ